MKNINRKIANILFIIFISIFILSSIAICIVLFLDNDNNDVNEFLNSSEITSSEVLVDNPINFSELHDINTEIYAWIRIPNTNIDYPIAQSATDDSFYLHHTIYKKYKFSGTIYTEMQNSKDFSDPNTVIYGHNMSKGYMFENLYKFQDEEFFNTNREFYIYTPENILTYTVYSAYKYDKRHILNSFDFSDEQVFADYIVHTKNPTSMVKNVRTDVDITTKDKIVTLSTCYGTGNKARYIVQGVLTNVQKTK